MKAVPWRGVKPVLCRPLMGREHRKGLAIALAAVLAAAAAACAPAPASPPDAPTASVLASFYPLHEVAAFVGGDRVSVANLVAAGDEAHDLELSARDLERLRQARLVLYVEGFQPGLERALATIAAPELVALDVTQGMALLESEHEHGHGHGDERNEHGHADGEADPDEHGHLEGDAHADERALDPHVWLDPVRMKDIVSRVRDALIELDPDGQGVYEANARQYQELLEALHQEFEQGLADCQHRELVVSHAAFGYLADRYDLEQEPIAGLSPEIEPSPQRMQEIIHFVREHEVKVIYFETLVSPRVAETIAREVGAATMVLNPIEGLTADEQAHGKTYFDLMRDNLANLQAGLECS